MAAEAQTRQTNNFYRTQRENVRVENVCRRKVKALEKNCIDRLDEIEQKRLQAKSFLKDIKVCNSTTDPLYLKFLTKEKEKREQEREQQRRMLRDILDDLTSDPSRENTELSMNEKWSKKVTKGERMQRKLETFIQRVEDTKSNCTTDLVNAMETEEYRRYISLPQPPSKRGGNEWLIIGVHH